MRFADDIIIGFEHEGEARRFLADMRQRMEKFALSLHPDKTRLIEFGRYAARRRVRRGLGKPQTFNFLGFTHICGRSTRGVFQLKRLTRRDRMRARLRAIKEELQRRMHEPIPLQGKWLGQVVRGYFAYHAVPTNCKALSTFRHYVMDLWRRALQRRSQRCSAMGIPTAIGAMCQATYQYRQVSYHRQAAGEVILARKWLIFNNSISRTNIGTGKAKGPGRHRAQ